MSLIRIVGLTLCLVFMLCFSDVAVAALPFNEEFDGGLTYQGNWQLVPNLTVQNAGTIDFQGNRLRLLRSPSVATSFPYVRSLGQIFPTSGAFSFSIKFKYLNLGGFGDGITVTRNETPIYPVAPNVNNAIFGVWQEANTYLQIATLACPSSNPSCSHSVIIMNPFVAVDLNEHTLDITYDETGVYRMYLDDSLSPMFVSAPNQVRPVGVWFGHPMITQTLGMWSSLEIDYFRVSDFDPAPTPTPEPTLYCVGGIDGGYGGIEDLVAWNETPPVDSVLGHCPVDPICPPDQHLENHVCIENARDPIVIIPGHGASWDYQAMFQGIPGADWQIPEYVKVYDNLIDSLDNTEYTVGDDLRIFTYDWRRSLDDLADDLNTYISGLSLPNGKVILVGHSYGGMVSRSYAQKYGGEKIDKIITISSPHQGTAVAYGAWEGAETWDRPWWQRTALEILLRVNQIPSETKVDTIRRISPSIRDLLPTENYLKDEGGLVKQEFELGQRNIYLRDLNEEFASIDGLMEAIGGNSFVTRRWIKTEPRNWIDAGLGKWEDGKPIDIEMSDLGDGTVLLGSARGPFSQYYDLNLNHEELISTRDGIEQIFERLGLDESRIVTSETGLSADRVLVILLRSPGVLSLTDGDGDVITDAINVPQAKMILWPNPLLGDYQIRVVENNGETGGYQIEVGDIRANGTDWQMVAGQLENNDSDYFDASILSTKVVLTGSQEIISEAIDEQLSQMTSSRPVLTELLGSVRNLIRNAGKTRSLTAKLINLRNAKKLVHEYHYWAFTYNLDVEMSASRNLMVFLDEWTKVIIGQYVGKGAVGLNQLAQFVERRKIEVEAKLKSNPQLMATELWLDGDKLLSVAGLDRFVFPVLAEEEYWSARFYFDEAGRY